MYTKKNEGTRSCKPFKQLRKEWVEFVINYEQLTLQNPQTSLEQAQEGNQSRDGV